MAGKEFHTLEVLGMKDDLWARVRGLQTNNGMRYYRLAYKPREQTLTCVCFYT